MISDPIQILTEAKEGKNFRCVEYSVVLHAALSCYSMKARVLSLRTRDLETRKSGAGHVAAECYLESFRKWALFDPQFDIHSEKDGIPLNAVELQRELGSSYDSVEMYTFDSPADSELKREYSDWICQYLFYFHTSREIVFPAQFPSVQIVLMPMGAKTPVKFQNMPIPDDLLPTNSYRAFYPGQDLFSWESQRGQEVMKKVF